MRVAERHGLDIHFVSNAYMRLPEGPLIHRVVVTDGPDAADDWIVERIGAGDIAVTADIPLAARCLKAGARVIGPTGRPFTEAGIGMALANARSLRPSARDRREQGVQRRLHTPGQVAVPASPGAGRASGETRNVDAAGGREAGPRKVVTDEIVP